MAGNIKGITIEINGDTTKLDKALRGVNKETRTVQRQLSEVERALKMDPGNSDLIKQKQRLLGEEIESTKSKLSMLKQADEQVASDMANGTEGAAEKHNELQRQIAITEAKEKALQKELDKLATVPSKAEKIAQGFENAGSKIKGVSDKVGKVGTGLSKGVTAPIAAVGAASAKAFTDVDEAMDTVVVKTGASGKALKGMQKNVENIATTIPTSFQAAGDAVGEVNTRFHLTGKQLESLSSEFVKFAEINGTDVTSSVQGAQMVMSAFGMKTKDAGALLGVFTSVSQKTGVSVDDLMNSLVQNGATFRDMGLSAQSAATLLGNFEAAGIDSNTAMSSLKKAMAAFQSEGIDVNQGLSDLIKSLTDGKVTTEDYNKAVDIFGKRGADAFVDMAKSGRLSLDGLTTNLSDYGTTVDDTFEGTLDPIDQAKVALNNLKVTGAEIFTSVQSVIAPMLDTLNQKLQSFNAWWKTLSPETQEMLVKIAMIAALVGPLLVGISKVGTAIGTISGGIGKMITIGGKLSKAFSDAGGMAGVMGKAIGFLTSPIGLVIAAIAAAIVVGVLLYKNWDKIKAAAKTVFTAVQKIITTVMNTIMTVITTIWSGIRKFFVTVLSAIAVVFRVYFKIYLTVAKTIFLAIKAVITTAMNGIRVVIRTVWNAIRGIFSSVTSAIKAIVTRAWNGIKSITSSIFHGVLSVTKSIWNSIKLAISSAVSAVRGVVSRGWHAIRSVTSSVFNAVKNAMVHPIQTALSVFRGIVSRIKGLFHFSISIPHIPLPHFSISPSGWKMSDLLKGKIPKLGINWYATGGIFDYPQVIGVGDAKSPEAVTPIDKLKGYVKDAVQESGGAGYVVNNYITVNGAEDPDDWAMRFTRTLKREMRMT